MFASEARAYPSKAPLMFLGEARSLP